MGGTEAVKAVEKGKLSLNSGKMGNRGEVHDFLDAGGDKNGSAGLTAGIEVGMIPENGQGMGCDSSGSHMNNTG